ncbi:MAG TPA: helix-turn-helix transcriptional regulator [Dehalococcoidia bacterium]|nr:helix-turn-helix transcriptional regulator [Dehalococcoidia bacterium]
MRDVSAKAKARNVPSHVRLLRLGDRIRWARKSAGLSHDRLVDRIGRSNRGHLIKVEQGVHTPGPELRNAIADATGVPRELFEDEDDEESDPAMVEAFEMFVALMDRVQGRRQGVSS